MFPRWLTWIFLLVMGYVIYAASGQNPAPMQPSQPVTIPPITKEEYPALAEATDIEHWKRALNPDYAARMNCSLGSAPKGNLALKIIEDRAGDGDGAACGDTITIHLTVWNAKGGTAYAGELPLALGSRQLAAGLDAGLLGIKQGGVRTLTLPPYALTRTKKSGAPAAALKALPSNTLAIVTVKRVGR